MIQKRNRYQFVTFLLEYSRKLARATARKRNNTVGMAYNIKTLALLQYLYSKGLDTTSEKDT